MTDYRQLFFMALILCLSFARVVACFGGGTNRAGIVVTSFYDVPPNATVLNTFPGSSGGIIRRLAEAGIAVEAIPGKPPQHAYGFVGPVSHSLHGTVDAPFGRSLFALQHRSGIALRFRKPQVLFAMTILEPTTEAEVGIKLQFFDANQQLLATVNADTRHVEGLGFDSRGCVFRGFKAEHPVISEVRIVPTHIPDKVKIVLAQVDYLCFADRTEDEELQRRIRQLVAELGATDYQVRERATMELASLAPSALSILNNLDGGDDPEVVMRLRRVVAILNKKKINLTPNGDCE